jgi:hypothetical protein
MARRTHLLISLLLLAGTLLAQDRDVQNIYIHQRQFMDSIAIPAIPPVSGSVSVFSRGKLGLFMMFPDASVKRVDSVGSAAYGDSARIAYEAMSIKNYTVVTMWPMFGGEADSAYITTSIKLGGGIQPRNVVIDSIKYSAFGGSCNVTPSVRYGYDRSASGTSVITSPSAVTSVTTPTTISSFNNATVPANNNVWLVFTDTTTKPWHLMWTVYGHYQ